ncbi:hypothetical protein DSECCO2_376370 [anaerobic digester metagenome]
MVGRIPDNSQRFFHLHRIVPVGQGQIGHAHDGVHRCADIVAHGGEEILLSPVGVSRQCQRAAQMLRPLFLIQLGAGNVAAHSADALPVRSAPCDADLFIVPLPALADLHNEGITLRFQFQPRHHLL